jgi:hypothetical protein
VRRFFAWNSFPETPLRSGGTKATKNTKTARFAIFVIFVIFVAEREAAGRHTAGYRAPINTSIVN